MAGRLVVELIEVVFCEAAGPNIYCDTRVDRMIDFRAQELKFSELKGPLQLGMFPHCRAIA